jgi:ATP-dependent Lhr-like helicase
MRLEQFHPLIQRWFFSRFAGPTEPQQAGWPRIQAGEHTLIAAPTGSGKTLTAFLAAIDRLVREAERGELPQEVRVVYISPLRALSNDMQRNLETPLAEIAQLARELEVPFPGITVGLRTGDTSPRDRARLIRNPPHILVTTPESLFLLLTSPRGRERLQTVETVIVDEIHALVRDKRGSHLALSLERLDSLCGHPIQRIGLSATQRPLERMAAFLVGGDERQILAWNAGGSVSTPGGDVPNTATRAKSTDHTEAALEETAVTSLPAAPATETLSEPPAVPLPVAAIVDVGHQRQLDLDVEIPPSELGAVCMHEQWAEINARLAELITTHRSTLIFVNTRRLAERITHSLTQIVGEDAVSSHHGSLAAERRHDTEQRLKNGQLKAVVATASLELGLDIGYIDLVIQIGSPRSIATFLQRVGRSGHALGLIPKGRLVALTRDELVECLALLRAVKGGRLDATPIPLAPLDILAQQIVAEVGCQEWQTDDLYQLVCRAWPYRQLSRRDFDDTLAYLSEGITPTNRGRVFLHHDQVQRRVRARKGARLIAVTNGGAIPEIASYRVVAEPDQTVVGTLDEDFASESQAGEVFLLGNTSWRILHVRGNDVTVADAGGAPPSIPFWRGEAPGRTLELSEEVSGLRTELEARVDDPLACRAWLRAETGVGDAAVAQVVEYSRAQKGAIGLLPTQRRVVFERFFDESGGMQLVIHAPFGARITKAWGLALRKRFCRSFDFELQATADDDGLILSLGPQHSFPLESMFPMLHENNVAKLLEQALLYVPTFQTRWRWNVTRALLVSRMKNGKKVPPPIQRFRADDLLTAVFPKLTGCQENITGDHVLPDHPLVRQSMHDAQQEAHDLEGLRMVMERIARGEIELVPRDTREPSPFCYELLNANPYAFLDGGEAVERRSRAVATRRSLTVESVSDLGRLDPRAIATVCAEAQPLVRSLDELHDLLLSRLAIPAQGELHECRLSPTWDGLFAQLVAEGRATVYQRADGPRFWVATERVPAVKAAFPEGVCTPPVRVPDTVRHDWDDLEARLTLLRGLLEVSGPVTSGDVAQYLQLPEHQVAASLEALEGEGVVLRGRFRSSGSAAGAAPAPVVVATPVPHAADDEAGEGCGDHHHEPVPYVPATPDIEWCHRRLLARIHRLTMEGLRKQIEPVTVDIFLRFLTRHHGLLDNSQRTGAAGVFEALSQLQGLDLPAVSWERDLLPIRVRGYRSEWLDELCLAGEVGWGRLYPPRRAPDRPRPIASLTRVVPLSLFLRGDLGWLRTTPAEPDPATLSTPGRQVLELLSQEGAMFAADLLGETRMLPQQLTDVLGELVSQGLVTADGFAGLRALVRREDPAPATAAGGLPRRRTPLAGAGRWSLWRSRNSRVSETTGTPPASPSPARLTKEDVTAWAWQLLRRWGIVFRDLLEREPGAPSWFELLQVLRRLEARGEIRGGRFITGVGGEQFAVGNTVRQLRQLRDEGPRQELVVLTAADPLNLVGIVTPHDRVPATASNRVVLLDGVPVVSVVGREIRWLGPPHPAVEEWLRTAAGTGTLELVPEEEPAGEAVPQNSPDVPALAPAAPPAERPRQRTLLTVEPAAEEAAPPPPHARIQRITPELPPPSARRSKSLEKLQARLARKKKQPPPGPPDKIPRPRW